MLQYTYDFDSNEVKVMETAVTSQNLEDKKKQEEAAKKALKEAGGGKQKGGKNRHRRSFAGAKLLPRRQDHRQEVQHPIPIHLSAVPGRESYRTARQYKMKYVPEEVPEIQTGR